MQVGWALRSGSSRRAILAHAHRRHVHNPRARRTVGGVFLFTMLVAVVDSGRSRARTIPSLQEKDPLMKSALAIVLEMDAFMASLYSQMSQRTRQYESYSSAPPPDPTGMRFAAETLADEAGVLEDALSTMVTSAADRNVIDAATAQRQLDKVRDQIASLKIAAAGACVRSALGPEFELVKREVGAMLTVIRTTCDMTSQTG